MKHFNFLLIAFSFFILASPTFAQKDSVSLNAIVQKKGKFVTDYPSERVYLHFDKPYYAVGDTMWFKAYVTLNQRVPSPLSKILYVDLLTQKDSLVESLKIPVTNSVATGSIPLVYQKHKQGNYNIRAYTKWMLNYDQAYFFKKNIIVGNSINKELNTNIAFTEGVTNDKTSKVTAKILYKDERGVPLMNKKVSWETIADFEKVAKGKGTTDLNGYLTVSFTVPSKVDIARAELFTSIETGKTTSLNSSFPLKNAILEHDIQFFPEGGDLIGGIFTKVAFKATSSNGLGVNLSGKILDKDGKPVSDISSQHAGMGTFSFIPENYNQYKAEITFNDGSKKTVNLPTVKTEGIKLAVSQDNENILLKISANNAFLEKNKGKVYYISAQSSGVIYYAAQSILKNNVLAAQIPKDKFPSGIIQITLLATNGTPISERLTFLKNKDMGVIKITPDKIAYNGRQKVKLDINTKNNDIGGLGNYSIAVIDETKVPSIEEKETSIWSSFLLDSELEGYIENPNYYFTNADEKKNEDLDILMLTQGYRRFTYKEVLENNLPKISYFPEQGIDITGTIRRSNGMTWDKARLLLQIPDRHFNSNAITDSEGKFKFSNVMFKDSTDVIINGRNNVNSAKDMRIMVDGEPYPSIYPNINKPSDILNIDSTLQVYLNNSKDQYNNAFMLKEVKVEAEATKKPSHLDHSALSGLSIMADKVTSGDQLTGCNNILNCLSSAGVTYIDNALFLTRTYTQGNRTPIEIYVNGMPVDVNYLNSIEPAGIESVEVFNNDGLTGINRRSNTLGVLVINLKEIKKTTISKDQLKELFPPQNMLTFKPKGYSVERHYYAPKYNGPKTPTQAPDLRTTIFWNPIVLTDENGNATIEYFNADEKGTYKIVIEGMDSNGNLSRGVQRYQIR